MKLSWDIKPNPTSYSFNTVFKTQLLFPFSLNSQYLSLLTIIRLSSLFQLEFVAEKTIEELKKQKLISL